MLLVSRVLYRELDQLTPFRFMRLAVETIVIDLEPEFTSNRKRPYLKNPDGCSVFRSELIAIDEALGSLASLPNGKEIWILSDSRSAIQHLANWQSVRDHVGVSISI
ncbi:RNase H domain-containing protein [Trichonephila clavipes]|nr:RNase H domain-containing protein [Trichonephila clavipes]